MRDVPGWILATPATDATLAAITANDRRNVRGDLCAKGLLAGF